MNGWSKLVLVGFSRATETSKLASFWLGRIRTIWRSNHRNHFQLDRLISTSEMADQYLLLVLTAASLASAALLTLAMMALFRRRSLSYYLIAAATGTLLVRSILGVVAHTGVFPGHTHHVVEHILDVTVVGLVFRAVVMARRNVSEPPADRRYGRFDD